VTYGHTPEAGHAPPLQQTVPPVQQELPEPMQDDGSHWPRPHALTQVSPAVQQSASDRHPATKHPEVGS
jgi:hypothetical protein